MKINKNHNKKRRIVIALSTVGFLVLVSVAAAIAVAQMANNDAQPNTPSDTAIPESKINLDAPTQEQLDAAQQKKEDSLTNDQVNQQPTSSLGVTITASNQNNTSSLLQIRTLIDAITRSGTCSLTLQQGAVIVSRSADIQAGPSNSTCKGFDIPLAELSAGTWSLTVEATSGNATGKATSQVVINAN